MAIETIAQIKTYFETGDRPTEAQFVNLIDTLANGGAKVYKALLTQSGTNAPVATVLENTLGGTVVWSRATDGVYLGTLTGAFTLDKTFVNLSGSRLGLIEAWRNNDDEIRVNTGGVDSIITISSITIEVYP